MRKKTVDLPTSFLYLKKSIENRTQKVLEQGALTIS